MSSNWHPDVADGDVDRLERPALPQDDFADEDLVTELEPRAHGGQRALIYPADAPDHVAADRWLTAPAETLVDLDDQR